MSNWHSETMANFKSKNNDALWMAHKMPRIKAGVSSWAHGLFNPGVLPI